MKNSEYWKRRFEILEEAELKKGQVYLQTLEQQYRIASQNIEKEISTWYSRFAKNNNVSLNEARRLLTTRELKEFQWSVKDYIKYGEENALNGQWMKQLENASARVHVSRLEALKLQMQQQIEVLYGNQVDGIDRLAKSIYSDGYYHTAFEVQKGFNVGWDLQSFNESQLQKAISKPWTVDMNTFRDRCWTNKQQLVGSVQTQMTQAILRGDAPDKAIKNIADRFGVDKRKAGRLVMTESAFFASTAQKDAFNDLDVERFEIVATLDMNTSEICQELDGKVFDMTTYESGVTAPPFHPWCRTTTVPYFDDNFGERAARDADGKTYYVPSDMKYKDWKKTFVDGGSKDGLSDIINNKMFPQEIAGVIRGTPMTRDDADGGKPNPNYKISQGYRINCQSCVVSYEARLRGYNVETLPNVKGSKLAELARQTNLAWIDPTTGTHPAYIYNESATTVKKFQDFLEKTIEKDKRYTLQFAWAGRSRSGHIISVDRDKLGALRFYDPQIGMTYSESDIKKYLGKLKYTMKLGGRTVSLPPRILRVDDKEFNLDVVNLIMKGVNQ